MTREHIIPKSLSRVLKGDGFQGPQFIPNDGGKYIEGESTIKDVCAKCNNDVLGSLDAYASEQFASQCVEFLHPNEARRITYDYALLTRWLMKVAYNSARISQIDAHLLRPYRQYIVGQSSPPKRLALFSMGVIPYEFSGDEQIRFKEKFGFHETAMYPDSFRISQIAVPGKYDATCVTRAFFFRSIAIYLLIGPKKMPESEFRELLADFRRLYPEAAPIKPRGCSTVVNASTRNAWDVMQFHTSAYPHLYGGSEQEGSAAQ